MQNLNTPENDGSDADTLHAADRLSTQARDRRRVLLKGIGKGSAVLAATVPLKTLAAERLLTRGNQVCTFSGAMSGAQSLAPGSAVTYCEGYRPSYWSVEANWPAAANKTVPVSTLLTKSTVPLGILSYMQSINGGSSVVQGVFSMVTLGSTYPDEVHWICAWLNAIKLAGGSGSSKFPYSADQVLTFYGETNSEKYKAALAFFSNNLENIG